MNKPDYKKLATLSPFELKNELIDAAAGRGADKAMLNAGRGNPNFLATTPRQGFAQFMLFAIGEAERSFSYLPMGVGGLPRKDGIEGRFDIFVNNHRGDPGVEFIRSAVSYVRDHLGIAAADFLYEMTEAILACNYPVPDRMLKLSERIVNQYLRKEMIGDHPFAGDFDMYAVEGGTAAMTYIFNTLKENGLIVPGDTIALATPIFTPYIEIPELNDYQLKSVYLEAQQSNNWQLTKADLDKLLDPKIKAFFLVNPSNPPSVKMSDELLAHMAEIVKQRPDLIVLTDDVYGTFTDGFVSLFASCPRNTILVYSFSKYFGSTGWRLGVVAMHQDNLLDKKVAQLPEAKLKELDERYHSITVEPRKLKLIDRLVADSRTVALNHTAGLSTPQQVQMVFFSLFALMDTHDVYKDVMQQLVRSRKAMLYRGMGVVPPEDPESADYYQLIDVEGIARERYGEDFVKWLLGRLQPNEALFRLASEAGVVVLPAAGFGASHPSFRVSLANLTEVEYTNIGKAIHKIGEEYYAEYLAAKKK